jgi:predicted SprT family Zn-dependent metalloprotease
MRGGKREGAGRKAGITHKGMETRTISIRVEKSKYQELKDICIEAIKENLIKKSRCSCDSNEYYEEIYKDVKNYYCSKCHKNFFFTL